MKFWLIVTSADNFRFDREELQFKLQGVPLRSKKQMKRMKVGDKVVYYVMGLQKFGAIARITGDYIEDHTKLWTNDDEMWPARRRSEMELALQDDSYSTPKGLGFFIQPAGRIRALFSAPFPNS